MPTFHSHTQRNTHLLSLLAPLKSGWPMKCGWMSQPSDNNSHLHGDHLLSQVSFSFFYLQLSHAVLSRVFYKNANFLISLTGEVEFASNDLISMFWLCECSFTALVRSHQRNIQTLQTAKRKSPGRPTECCLPSTKQHTGKVSGAFNLLNNRVPKAALKGEPVLIKWMLIMLIVMCKSAMVC